MKNFQKYNLSKDILNTLNGMNIKIPTPIQEKAIPLILLGNDILGSAQTGTGKTAAFCIPMIEILMKSNKGSALILTPTRELAKQISDVIKILIGHKRELKSVSLIGGESMGKQLSDNLYMNLTYDVNNNNFSNYELSYRVNKNVSIVGGEDDEGLHLKYRFKYQY